MSALVARRLGLIIGIFTCSWFPGIANAQREVSIERVSLKVADAFEPGAAVIGELRIPNAKPDRRPAVLILNSTPGFDGRGKYYAEALNQAGFATLEIDMFQGRGMPATPRHNMPHVYETLAYLAGHQRIDPVRIGVMGFSYGGTLSVLTSSEELTRQYAGNSLRFAAHLGLYPICWRHQSVLAGTHKHFEPSIYQRVTGKPVQILAGDKDDYDGADGCQKFLAELPPKVRPHFSVTVYTGATFGWDSRFGSAVFESSANRGKGGIVKVIADPEIANRSREFAVAYFKKGLGAD